MQLELLKHVLPKKIVEYFELVDIKEAPGVLHLYLNELNIIPPGYAGLGLSCNGFYDESTVKDFPPRDKKVLLHVRRRRWVDDAGKSCSRSWELTAEGTRYPNGICVFFKRGIWMLARHQPNPLGNTVIPMAFNWNATTGNTRVVIRIGRKKSMPCNGWFSLETWAPV